MVGSRVSRSPLVDLEHRQAVIGWGVDEQGLVVWLLAVVELPGRPPGLVPGGQPPGWLQLGYLGVQRSGDPAVVGSDAFRPGADRESGS